MQYIDQQADQLRLNVILGAVPREQVQILCSAKLAMPQGCIEAHVIGASHFFEWQNSQGEVIFSELFACQKLEVKESLCYASIEQSKDYKKNIANVSYHFTARKFRWNDKLVSHFLSPNQASEQIFTLKFQFPNVSANLKRDGAKKTAVTLLMAQKFDQLLQLDSLHAYPNEGQLVVSQTKIILPKSQDESK